MTISVKETATHLSRAIRADDLVEWAERLARDAERAKPGEIVLPAVELLGEMEVAFPQKPLPRHDIDWLDLGRILFAQSFEDGWRHHFLRPDAQKGTPTDDQISVEKARRQICTLAVDDLVGAGAGLPRMQMLRASAMLIGVTDGSTQAEQTRLEAFVIPAMASGPIPVGELGPFAIGLQIAERTEPGSARQEAALALMRPTLVQKTAEHPALLTQLLQEYVRKPALTLWANEELYQAERFRPNPLRQPFAALARYLELTDYPKSIATDGATLARQMEAYTYRDDRVSRWNTLAWKTGLARPKDRDHTLTK